MKPRAACLPCPLLSRPPLPCSFSMEVKLDVWKVPGTAWSKQSATPERPFMQNTANVENLLGHAATSRWSVSLPLAQAHMPLGYCSLDCPPPSLATDEGLHRPPPHLSVLGGWRWWNAMCSRAGRCLGAP